LAAPRDGALHLPADALLDPVVYDWAPIKANTLVIGGELDGENFPALAKHIADTVPHAKLVIIPKAGHVPLEMPDTFHGELLKFLDGVITHTDVRPRASQPV
jgi:pimeloyl-ACP methyl ester carboxylesterase